MMKAKMAGAVVLPAMPGFYHKPKNLKELVNFVVGKILDILKIEHNLYQRWGTEEGEE
jgi:4-hydroxy-3-polyprenylbenzoate decarboxylase